MTKRASNQFSGLEDKLSIVNMLTNYDVFEEEKIDF